MVLDYLYSFIFEECSAFASCFEIFSDLHGCRFGLMQRYLALSPSLEVNWFDESVIM